MIAKLNKIAGAMRQYDVYDWFALGVVVVVLSACGYLLTQTIINLK